MLALCPPSNTANSDHVVHIIFRPSKNFLQIINHMFKRHITVIFKITNENISKYTISCKLFFNITEFSFFLSKQSYYLFVLIFSFLIIFYSREKGIFKLKLIELITCYRKTNHYGNNLTIFYLIRNFFSSRFLDKSLIYLFLVHHLSSI